MKTNTKMIAVLVVLLLTTTACELDLSAYKFWEFGEVVDETGSTVATFTPIPTATPVPESQTDPTPTFTVVVPTITQAPTASGPSTTATGASCLPGDWQINHESVTTYIRLSMLSVQEYGFTPQTSEGKLELQIHNGQIVLEAEDFTVGIGVNVGQIANLSAFSASIDAQGFATYYATDGQAALTNIMYDADGTVTSLSASLAVDFQDLLALAQTLGFARGLPASVTHHTISYTCSGDTLTIQVNPYAAVSFDRILTP